MPRSGIETGEKDQIPEKSPFTGLSNEAKEITRLLKKTRKRSIQLRGRLLDGQIYLFEYLLQGYTGGLSSEDLRRGGKKLPILYSGTWEGRWRGGDHQRSSQSASYKDFTPTGGEEKSGY